MTMNKAWAAKLKKFARPAGVNESKKNCHGVRKARAEVAAYSECTEAQMMAMLGWRGSKMPALLEGIVLLLFAAVAQIQPQGRQERCT